MDHRRGLRRAAAAAAAALVLAVLTGCSAPLPSEGGSGVLGSGFHLAQIDRALPAEDRAMRTERVAAPQPNEYAWTVGSVDPTSRRVRLSYLDGACTSADLLEVQETAASVTVAIRATKRFDGACIAVGIPRSTTVVLRRPLGTRALLEGASGADDGLPTVSDPDALPTPTCGSADVSDAPAGMAETAVRMAPTTATTVFACRTWWPKGSAREESRSISGRAAVAALAAAVNDGVRSARPGPVPMLRCPKHVHGSWYAVYFEGPRLQVEVKADEIGCSTITNGARSGTMSPTLAHRLDALFE